MGSSGLQKLYEQVDECRFCRANKNLLQHVYGFGTLKPNLMLILVNPTYRNLSSDPEYRGARFPFIGVRQFWKVLAEGDLIDKEIASELPLRTEWTSKHTDQVKKELIRNRLFLTNIVKCCYNYSSYPANEVIKDSIKTLAEEIRIVRPQKIIAFSGLVYKTLTGKNIKLSDYWGDKNKESSAEVISGLNIITEPCYFPIGRGNPKKAAEIIRKFAQN